MSSRILVVGTGYMGREYARSLTRLGVDFRAVGRSLESRTEFEAIFGVPVGSRLEQSFQENWSPDHAIIATDTDQLAPVAENLIELGCGSIIVEKPVALDVARSRRLQKLSELHGAKISVGYNRRFFPSVQVLLECLRADGGVRSVHFDFSERYDVGASSYSPLEKSRWMLCNSSHVLDLAFFIAGAPVSLCATRSGSSPWHPSGMVFQGSGMTDRGVMISYSSDWQSPGSWSVEVQSEKRRFLLKPLEQLQLINPDGEQSLVPTGDFSDDGSLKPGLTGLLSDLLSGRRSTLCDLDSHILTTDLINEIAGYPSEGFTVS